MLKELDKKYQHYVGIDEAGRGCIGGSMFFVGTVLKPGITIDQIVFADDSKKLTPKKREQMYYKLKELVNYHVVRTSAEVIDSITLARALKESLINIKEWAEDTPIIYDGSTNYKVPGIETLIKADAKISLVSAASIIAKYLKDRESLALSEKYPEFDFAGHKGYINKKHTQEIIKYGYTKHHRKSYNVKAFKDLNILTYKEK